MKPYKWAACIFIFFIPLTPAYTADKLTEEIAALRDTDPERAIVLAKQALPASEGKSKERLYKLLGDAYSTLGDFSSAEYAYFQAFVFYYRNADWLNAADQLNEIGYLRFTRENYTGAMQLYALTYRLAQRLGDKGLEMTTLTYMAQVQGRLGRWRSALAAYRETLLWYSAQQQYRNLAVLCNNIGNVYLQMERPDSALWYYSRALNALSAQPDTLQRAITSANIGQLYLDESLPDSALPYLQDAAAIFYEYRYAGNLADVYYNLYRYAAQRVKPELQLEYALAAYQYATITQHSAQLARAAYILSEWYAGQSNFAEAYRYSQLHTQSLDSLYNLQAQEVRQRMAQEFETERKEDQIAMLGAASRIKDLEIEAGLTRQRFYLLGLIICGIVLLFFGVLFYQRRKRLHLLREKNRLIRDSLAQKELMLREIHHRIKNNLQIVSSLLTLQQHLPGDKTPEELLQLSQQRIALIALIHEKLYQSESPSRISLKAYLDDFFRDFSVALLFAEKQIRYEIDTDAIEMDMDRIIPFGLVLAELVTNSVRHAFAPGQSGYIRVECRLSGNEVNVCLSDNGRGLPSGFSFAVTATLGMRLVAGLVKQVNGRIQVVPGREGACFNLSFPY